jgi:hypothetical protein
MDVSVMKNTFSLCNLYQLLLPWIHRSCVAMSGKTPLAKQPKKRKASSVPCKPAKKAHAGSKEAASLLVPSVTVQYFPVPKISTHSSKQSLTTGAQPAPLCKATGKKKPPLSVEILSLEAPPHSSEQNNDGDSKKAAVEGKDSCVPT